MSALVEVTEVEVSQREHEGLVGFGIDRPESPSERSTYSLAVRGWALGRGAPVEAVELIHDGAVLRSAALAGKRDDVAAAHPDVDGAAASEFYAVISSLRVSPKFEIVVRAVLADGARVTIGAVRGRRAPVRSGFEAHLLPLMLTSTGRVGSTVLMNALGAHPQIAAYPPFRKEPRVACYWMDVFATLSDPASYVRQLAPGGPLHDGWWLGAGEPMPRTTVEDEVERWMAADAVESLAALCQARIEALYERIAAANGRSGATYFAEKFRTDPVPALMWELYPHAREVILVRDFRDVACSVVASSAKRKSVEQALDAEAALEDIQGRAEAITHAYEARSDHVHLVRYEDLIRRPEEVLKGIVEHLGLESGADLVGAMVDALSEGGSAAQRHRTSPEPEASIGRWRRDLDPETQREFELALRPALEAFGYELEVT